MKRIVTVGTYWNKAKNYDEFKLTTEDNTNMTLEEYIKACIDEHLGKRPISRNIMIKQLAEEALLQVQTRPSGSCNMELYNLVFARKIIDKCVELALANEDVFTALDINEYFKDKE